MRMYRLYQVDAFTREKLMGNPAGVIANADGLTDAQMQRIARELNHSETAFLFTPTDATHDVWVRFFTPRNEVPICGHATVAAHYVRATENALGNARVMQKTGAGILPVDVIRDGEDYRIVMTQGSVSFGENIVGKPLKALLAALRLSPDDLRTDCPVQIVSTGHSKVMIPLRDVNLLHRLHPDSEGLIRVSGQIGCNGFYPFTIHPNDPVLVHGRMFAPAIGIPEDPVTGNANGPLGAYLYRYGQLSAPDGEAVFTAQQGEAVQRAGQMEVRVKIEKGEPVQVRIIGNAVIVFSATLALNEL